MATKYLGGENLDQLCIQPGAEFDATDSGFDTGNVVFRCYTSKAHILRPRIGAAFSDIRFLGRGKAATRGAYPWMFVKSCKEVEAKLGISTFSVTLRGQLTFPGQSMPRSLKAPFIQEAQAQQQIDAGGTQITIATPVATSTYLVLDLDDLDPMNTEVAAPPGIASPDLTFEGITFPEPAYAGWRITGRASDSAGTTKKRIIQVQDTITYTLGI